MALSMILSLAIKISKFGLGLFAIREDEDAAVVLGVNATVYKAIIYSVSAFLPAVAGTLMFYKNGMIDPSIAFEFMLSLEGIVMLMLGGKGTVIGAALGGGLYEKLRSYLLTSPKLSNFHLVIAGGAAAGGGAVCSRRLDWLALSPGAALREGDRMTALLEVNGVTKRFGGLVAVSDVTFTLSEGEILGLIGPNGAGKTTLFNMVNGVYKLDKGTISFAGKDITNRPPNEVVHLGIARTHQIVKPLYGMTVLENVTVGACFGRDYLQLKPSRKVAMEVLERVGLADRANTSARSLTIAGKKRLEVARALAARPKLLLLDEVLAGLNPTEVEMMIGMVRNIRDSGISVLMIEHLMQAIMSLSDRIVVLNLGAKLAEGPPEEVVQDPNVVEAYLGFPDIVDKLRGVQ